MKLPVVAIMPGTGEISVEKLVMKAGERGAVRQRMHFYCKPRLAASVAILVCTGVLLLFIGAHSAFAAGDNSWQIVSGRYDPAHKTSEGIPQNQLGDYSFVESPDGSVCLTKTVEPTGVEDEFIVRLSVDTCAISSQQTDYYTFFTTAPYQGVTSNWAHSMTPGTVTGSVNGSGIDVTGNAGSNYGKSGVFDIQYPAGKTIAKNVKLYWNKGNNTTIFLELDKSHYVLMGVEVNKDSHNTVVLSDEAYNLINEKIKGQVKPGPAPTLNSVADVMGGNIEFLGSVNADAGSASFDGGTSTLTWNPQYSSSAKKVVEEPVYDYEYTEGGAVAKLTITQKTWYYGAASLTYKVRLKTADGIASSYHPDGVTNPYFTNDRATLDYTYSTYNKDDNQFHEHPNATCDFPKPQVKGITYDLRALKWNADDDTPLAGATFKLTRAWTDSNGVAHNDLVSDSLKSGEDGFVTMTGLPWGNYTLEETTAPTGFVLPRDTVRTFSLSYTNAKGGLTSSTISAASEHHAMNAEDAARIDNERVKTDVSLRKVDASDTDTPLEGAHFRLYRDNGDGAFDPNVDAVRYEGTTDENGAITFGQLTVGTYFLQETKTPAGYQLNTNIYRIQVFDVRGQAGGAEDNMIQVGDEAGGDMRAPETANTVTVADKPIPVMPVTAGPGSTGSIRAGLYLVATGALALVAMALRSHCCRPHGKHSAR